MKVLIISGGNVDIEWAENFIKKIKLDYIIAADRGLCYAYELGIKVDLVLGDYDSVDQKILDIYKENTDIKTFPVEKDYTDTHLAVKYAINAIRGNYEKMENDGKIENDGEMENDEKIENYEKIENDGEMENDGKMENDGEIENDGKIENDGEIENSGNIDNSVEIESGEDLEESAIYMIGATGTRFDHSITNISIMKEAMDSGIECFIFDKYNKIYMKNKTFTINKVRQYGKYVSFVPASEKVILSLQGMKYDINDYSLSLGESICQSNEIKDERGVVIIKQGTVITFETKD